MNFIRLSKAINMLRVIIGLLSIVLAGTLEEFVGIYDLSRVPRTEDIDLPALATAIVPRLFQPALTRCSTDGLAFDVDLGGPALWKCVCVQFIYPIGTTEYCKTTRILEAVRCTQDKTTVSFNNYATYVDQRTVGELQSGVEPAKHHLTQGRLELAYY